jgi:acylphosphatase
VGGEGGNAKKNPSRRGEIFQKISGLQKKRKVGKTALMSAANEVHHKTVHFSGRVQGVGFRYTALQIAREFEVAGYVQNLPDGRVCIEVEGAMSEVSAFVAAIEESMHGYIHTAERAERRGPPQFRGFTVR